MTIIHWFVLGLYVVGAGVLIWKALHRDKGGL